MGTLWLHPYKKGKDCIPTPESADHGAGAGDIEDLDGKSKSALVFTGADDSAESLTFT